MKHCRKAPVEPDCLADFRRKNPDADWERDFRRVGEGRSCFELILHQLQQDQWGLCAYCEVRLGDNERRVEHFRAKTYKVDSHNPAFDWDNLWLVCKGGSNIRRQTRQAQGLRVEEVESCDHVKSDQPLHDRILSPAEVPAFPRLFRYQVDDQTKQVRIEVDKATCREAEGIDIAKVECTIAELNLNCRRLCEARFRVYLDLEAEKERLRYLADKNTARNAYQSLVARYLDPDGEGRRRAFFTLIRERLGRTAENHLHRVGYQG